MNQSGIPIQTITFEETISNNSTDRHIIDHTNYIYPHTTSVNDNKIENNGITTIVTQSELLSNHIYAAQKRINELLTKLIEHSK